MHVAVIIVAYRNPDDVLGCLKSLSLSTYSDFEVVICENGGIAPFSDMQSRLPPTLAGGQRVTVVLADKNGGYASGINICLKAAPAADCWWILNPDTEPAADAMALKVRRLRVGDCDAVGCIVRLASGTIQSYGGHWQKFLARAVSIGHGLSGAQPPDASAIESRQNYLNGAAMLVSRSFLDLAGPICEEYFLYCEEVEWCLRGLQRGARLAFEPQASVLHHQGTTTGNVVNIRQRTRGPVYLNERNRLLLTRDRFPSVVPIAAFFSFIMIFAKYGRRQAWRQVVFALSGWAAGLRNERGVPVWMDG